MADNAVGEAVFTKKVTCSTLNQELDLLQSRHYVYIVADGDCFINFDKDVTTNGRFLIKANEPYEFEFGGGVKQLNYLDAAGTANLYVIAHTKW